jgi:hypothetical protein
MELFISVIVHVVPIWFHVPILARFISEQVLDVIMILEVQLWQWRKIDFSRFDEPAGRDGLNGKAFFTPALSK